MIPRPQGNEICVSHNANVIPTMTGYYMVAAYYMGGNTVVDFTDPTRPREIAYSDPMDTIGCADSWSTYWYNDYIYANGGLGRRGSNCPTAPGALANRGVDVFRLLEGDDGNANGIPDDIFRTRKFHHMNPQTQEVEQTVGDDGHNNNASRQPGDGIQ
jgi:hypothetical protein